MNRHRARSTRSFSGSGDSGGSGRSGFRSGGSGGNRFAGSGGSGGSRRPRRSQGSGGRPAAASGEFALPKTITPALPAVETFAELDLPARLLTALEREGVTEPFPIQAATLPNSLAGRDVLGRGRTG
ncbi:DEAD/DEAH box helicase, partial [Streptomyces sp. SID9944]|nr:DEAD/DEAH box helicase [Streptomyces sp. SID9944]